MDNRRGIIGKISKYILPLQNVIMYIVKLKDVFYPLLTKRSQPPNFEVAGLKSVKVRRLHGNTSFYIFIWRNGISPFPYPIIHTVRMTWKFNFVKKYHFSPVLVTLSNKKLCCFIVTNKLCVYLSWSISTR